MSAIAGLVRFDGAPAEPGVVERMTAAMRSRGPDGIRHWRSGPASLGQCMLRTTPEAVTEVQPLADERLGLALVMDGRVDNAEELRRELLARGLALRDLSDAELVLRAYEAWGESCPEHIIGEFVVFLWDSRRGRLFAARDAAGTRHFYYHSGNGWFAFASEIAGLLATRRIRPRLNESRLLDYLSDQYERDDQEGTFYEGITRLPAGHAMRVTARGLEAWRYWDPANLPALQFASLDECAEAFLEQFRAAVKCRLRSHGPVGAMLSGGLDSSSIVALIGREFRAELAQPLQTYSLVLEDREQCPDWRHIREILRDPWFDPIVLTSAAGAEACRSCADGIADLNEPWSLYQGFTDTLVYEAARQRSCRVVLDGMASDLYFYGATHSLRLALRGGLVNRLPAEWAAWRRHLCRSELPGLAWTVLHWAAPTHLRAAYRRFLDRYGRLGADLRFLHRPAARRYLREKLRARRRSEEAIATENDQQRHARNFTTGTLSFAHEVNGQAALCRGVEPRSPFSDRRLIEFAVRMPLAAKLFGPWYKLLLRKSMAGILPESVRWRRRREGHPGWQFHERLIAGMARRARSLWDRKRIGETLAPWIRAAALNDAWRKYESRADLAAGLHLFRLSVLARWLNARQLTPAAEAQQVEFSGDAAMLHNCQSQGTQGQTL